MIHEVLPEGAENAVSSVELQNMLGLTKRQVTRVVEAERRAGHPICASTISPKGYYLAATKEEMEAYCRRLQHRQREVDRTRLACLATMDSLPSECR